MACYEVGFDDAYVMDGIWGLVFHDLKEAHKFVSLLARLFCQFYRFKYQTIQIIGTQPIWASVCAAVLDKEIAIEFEICDGVGSSVVELDIDLYNELSGFLRTFGFSVKSSDDSRVRFMAAFLIVKNVKLFKDDMKNLTDKYGKLFLQANFFEKQ